ncbi:MAG: hypothetical protein ACKOB4_12625 [Acidobacteriota bacterium]
MKMIISLEDAVVARYELERFMIGTPAACLGAENGIIARTPPAELEWSVSWGKLILSWWDSDQSQSVRITGYKIEPSRVILLARRGLSPDPWRLVIDRQIEGQSVQLEVAPEDRDERRQWYAERLLALLRRSLPGVRIRHWSTGADLRHRVPGRFARMILTRQNETILAIGASEAENQETIDGLIAAGLIWYCNYNADRQPSAGAQRLWFLAPATHARSLTERVPLLCLEGDTQRRNISCFEVDEIRGEMTEVRPVSQLELLTTAPHDLIWPALPASLDQVGGEWHRRLVGLAPGLIEPRYRATRRVISYEINGLEFARLPIDDWLSAEFGVPGDPERADRRRRPLTERNLPELQQLISRLTTLRSGASPDQRHPFFRLHAEGWLESLLRRDIRALDPQLDPRYVYSQIPTWHANQRGVIDLLTIKHEQIAGPERGRLVVIEIKATEDPQLPIQGLDYWMRIEQARVRGEFGRHGLFAGARIADQPPLLYLVAPRLRFHRSFLTIGRCLDPRIDAYRLGLNHNWRDGVRVHTLELLRHL